eukprot:5149242-Amphidinium_carterae.1
MMPAQTTPCSAKTVLYLSRDGTPAALETAKALFDRCSPKARVIWEDRTHPLYQTIAYDDDDDVDDDDDDVVEFDVDVDVDDDDDDPFIYFDPLCFLESRACVASQAQHRVDVSQCAR